MTATPQSKFVYVTYIKTTAEKLWEALTSREFMAQYWLGNQPEADWRVGGSWKIVRPNGELADSGEVLEFEPKKRIVIKWRNEFMPELKAEGFSLCTMEIEPAGKPGEESMKLTVTHAMERSESKLIVAVGGGWPLILSNLKSVLETGVPLLTKK
jgi:uncharacterized protein YndB with AHSA1/START domain